MNLKPFVIISLYKKLRRLTVSLFNNPTNCLLVIIIILLVFQLFMLSRSLNWFEGKVNKYYNLRRILNAIPSKNELDYSSELHDIKFDIDATWGYLKDIKNELKGIEADILLNRAIMLNRY